MNEVRPAVVDLVELEAEVQELGERDLGLRQQSLAPRNLFVDVDTRRRNEFVEQGVVVPEAVVEFGVVRLVADVDGADEVDADAAADVGNDAQLQRPR